MRTPHCLRFIAASLLALLLIGLSAQTAPVSAEGDAEYTAEQQAVVDLFLEINKHRKAGDSFTFNIFDASGAEVGKIVREVLEVKDGIASLNETTSMGPHSQTQTTTEPDPKKMFKEDMALTVEDCLFTHNNKEYKDGKLITLTMSQNMGGRAIEAVTKMWFSPSAPSGMIKLSQTMNGQPQYTATLNPESKGLSENMKKYLELWKTANASRKPGTVYEYEIANEFHSDGNVIPMSKSTERAELLNVGAAGAKLRVQTWDTENDAPVGEARDAMQPIPLNASDDAEFVFNKSTFTAPDGTKYEDCDEIFVSWEIISPQTGESAGFQSITITLSAQNGAGLVYMSKLAGHKSKGMNFNTTTLSKIISKE